jgi:ABC-type branched-subunit amino acid transport system substrate-binding protein
MAVARTVVLLLVVATWRSPAQVELFEFRPDAEQVFVSGMQAFRGGEYDSALVRFSRCLTQFPRNHRTTAAYIMGSKAAYHLGLYQESVRLAKNLLDMFPSSAYVDDGHYTLGLSYYRLGRFDDAAHELMVARQVAQDSVLSRRSETLLSIIIQDHLTVEQVTALRDAASTVQVRTFVTIRLAEKAYHTGNIQLPLDLLRPFRGYPPEMAYVQEGLALLERIERGGSIEIAVVLPLMRNLQQQEPKELGQEMLNGIRLAVTDHNKVGLPKVKLVERDSQRDPGVAARAVTELCSDDKITGILGPIFSNETFAAAGIANARGVPLVTPTATANGIAAIGPFVFQLNPDYETRGRATARYAMDSLGLKTFGVLAPTGGSGAGRAMAEAFVDEVRALGGETVDAEWYDDGATDLRFQLSTMRRRGLERTEVPVIDFSSRLRYEDLKKMLSWGVPARLIDSLAEREDTVSVEVLFGPRGTEIADSLGIKYLQTQVDYDSLEIPVTTIDGIFLPISSADEIGIVASQIRYFNFHAQLLGNGEWYDIAELDENREYANGVIFSHDTYVDEASSPYQLFSRNYMSTFARRPSLNSLYGYDAMALILSLVRDGYSSRQSLAEGLARVQVFHGLRADFCLDANRVNSYLTVLQFKGRSLRKIGSIDIHSSQRP